MRNCVRPERLSFQAVPGFSEVFFCPEGRPVVGRSLSRARGPSPSAGVVSDGRCFAESLPPLLLRVALHFRAVSPSAFGSGGRCAVCALRRILRFSRSRKRLLAALCPGQRFCPRLRRGTPSPSFLLSLPVPCARMQARHGRHGRRVHSVAAVCSPGAGLDSHSGRRAPWASLRLQNSRSSPHSLCLRFFRVCGSACGSRRLSAPLGQGAASLLLLAAEAPFCAELLGSVCGRAARPSRRERRRSALRALRMPSSLPNFPPRSAFSKRSSGFFSEITAGPEPVLSEPELRPRLFCFFCEVCR